MKLIQTSSADGHNAIKLSSSKNSSANKRAGNSVPAPVVKKVRIHFFQKSIHNPTPYTVLFSHYQQQ